MRSTARFSLGLALAASLTLGTAGAALAEVGGRPFTVALTGAAEVNAQGVPNQGDPDGIGTAVLRLNSGLGEICYELEVTGITLPAAAAHIHVAPSTAPGPVVVGLSAP